MRIASWSWGGRAQVGTISPDGREATPLAVADAARGALPLIEALARGESLPAPSGARLPVEAIELRAPLPRPLRSIFCVGRNYRAHAAELADSVFRASLPKEDAWPIVFTKLAECVVGPHDAVRLPGAAVSSQIDYESRARRRHRPRRPRHRRGRGRWTTSSATRSSTTSPRATSRCATSNGTSARASTPSARWARGSSTADEMDGRATRVRGWVNGELRQDGVDAGHDLRHPDADRDLLARHHALPGRRDRDRHAGRASAWASSPPRWLVAGDVVRIEIDGIGAIENRFE